MTDAPHLVDVRLLEVPVAVRGRSMQHGEELVREMTLVAQSEDLPGTALPQRLVQLAKEVRSTYGVFSVKADQEFDAAVARGDEVIDELVYHVPPTMGPFVRHLIEVLDEADAYCRAGQHLLTLATPPDIAAYRLWVLREFERQLAGEPPVPWPRFAAESA